MNVDRFLEQLPAQYAGFPQRPVALDRRYFDILTRVPGYTCAPVGALLNLACTCLAAGEIYLEAGSLNGASLACALVDNLAHATAIDNFSEFHGSRAKLQHTLHTEQIASRVTVIEADTLMGLARLTDPVGVFFYDADHSYEATLAALHGVTSVLAEHALIVVDDYNWPEVRQAVTEFCMTTRAVLRYELLTTNNMQYDSWWNGLALLSYQED